MPDIVIELFTGQVETILVDIFSGITNDSAKFFHPFHIVFGVWMSTSFGGRSIFENKARDVPEFVREELITSDFFFIEGCRCSRGVSNNQTHTEGISSVFFSEHNGVHDVSFTLTHLVAVLCGYDSVEVNDIEWDFFCPVESEHNHSCDPEKN